VLLPHRRIPAGGQTLQDSLAYVLVELFIGDVVSLVWKTFGDAIEAECQNDDPRVMRSGKKKKKAYSSWSTQRYPLAMDAELVTLQVGNGRPTARRIQEKRYSNWDLLMIISGKEINNSRIRWTTQDLGEKLVDLAKAIPPRRAKAPLIHGGLLHHTLPVAQERLVMRSKNSQVQEGVEKALGTALKQALEVWKVEFVPYHKPAEAQSHPSAADPRWWIKVSHPSKVEGSSGEEFACSEEGASEETVQSPTGSWDVPSKPQHFRRFVHKTILPQDWDLKHASLGIRENRDVFIYDTYHWVQNNYDGTKELHQMALLWSIMFASLLPRIAVPQDVCISTTNCPTLATTEVLAIPWEIPTRKGLTAPLPYVVMVTCVVISYFEPESPLRKHLDGNQNKLGSDWTKKHGAFYYRVLLWCARLTEAFLWVQDQSASTR